MTGLTTPLAGRVIALCISQGATLAVAESLTGGMLASELVNVPGASRVFRGGVVAYDTALKSSLLGVDHELLLRAGPVHEDVARQMAQGVRIACAVAGVPADIGLSTTGVAGPSPDTQTGQPAGTVWIAWDIRGVTGAEKLSITGDRSSVRELTVEAILQRLLLNLSQVNSGSECPRE